MSMPSSNWFSHWAVRAFANASRPGKIQAHRRCTRRPAQQISLESLEPRQMLSVNYQMASVGNPGNAPDTSPAGYGAVSYDYQIGKYDVTVGQYAEFLNAKAQADPYGLYNASMGTDRISRSGTSGSYTYAVMNSTGNRPVTHVSWFDSARFANWMSNGQGSASTETGGYTLINGQTTGNAPAANDGAGFRIPTENEWYKAAYFSPDYRDSGEDGYYNYATQSDTLPGTGIGSGKNQANYNNVIGQTVDVGTFPGSGSFYGTFDQSGNVFQWNDLNGTAGSSRGLRGGDRYGDAYDVSSSNRDDGAPGGESDFIGFRVVSPVTTTLTPTFGATTPTATGFTVQITNYSSSYTWAGTATASGSVVVSGTGLVTVTGVAANTSSIATITTTKSNTVGGSAQVTATSLVGTTLTPTFGSTTATATGFTVQISNYNASYTWAGTATASGSVVVSGSGLVTVTGVAAATSSTATITTTKSNTVGGSATVTATSLGAVNMNMVTVGNAGNAADNNTGSVYGAVSYSYQIGAYDVTGSQYTAFLNAVGSTDTYGLYNTNMGTDTDVAQISQSGSSGSYTYAVLNSTGSRPISYVSWFDSARFSNWMSNGQPSGAQNSTTTENGAYNVNGATTGNAVAANATNPNTSLAPTYRIPLENEWYKAAYYKGGSTNAGYWTYATQSDSVPGTTIGSSANQANYNNIFGHTTDVGSFSGSESFYGTFDQTGNVYQWNDLDGTTGSSRGTRGGVWNNNSYDGSSSSYRNDIAPSFEFSLKGFRLASPV